jgi:hypothetical protein
MARGRFITNTLGDSEKFSSLTSDTHRLAYVLLVTYADAEGRFSADPITLNGKLYTRLGWDARTVLAALEDMHQAHLITLYAVDGKRYGVVTDFHKHNKIRRKADGTPHEEAPTRVPAPPEQPTSNAGTGAVHESYRGNTRVPLPEVEVEVKGKGKDKDQLQPPLPPHETATLPIEDDAAELAHAIRSQHARQHDHRVLMHDHPDIWRALGGLVSTYDWKEPQLRAIARKVLALTREHTPAKMLAALDKVLLNASLIRNPIAFAEAILARDAANALTGAPSPITDDHEFSRLFGTN